MTPMTAAEIDALNAAYDAARDANPDESTHILTARVALDANLEVQRRDDESGVLYRHYPTGRLVYGWESGGFSGDVDE